MALFFFISKSSTEAMVSIDISFVACLIGLVLALYALHVEDMHTKDPGFVSLCDFSEKSSCGHVFNTPQGKIWSYLGVIPKGHFLDQPNALYGFIFYNVIATLTFFKKNLVLSHLALALGLFSAVLSVYLGYILMFLIEGKDGTKGGHTCILCMSTWACNFIIFGDTWRKMSKLRKELKESKSKKAN